MQLRAYLHQKHSASIVGVCFLLIGLVAIADHFTGFEFSFSIFYLAPVIIASWFGGRIIGTIVAITCAIVWLVVDVTSGHVYSNLLISFWNSGVRLGFFLLTSHLVSKVRFHLDREKELARSDPLTGVLNGRAFFEQGRRLFALAGRTSRPLSIAYVDLDNFKAINDARGHTEGDRLLRDVANILKGSLRSYDLVARLGGDEFALLLPDSDLEDSQYAIGRLRKNLSAFAREQGWPISVSVGIVVFKSTPPTLEQAVKLADELMYSVKKAGKGNVVHRVWNSDLISAEPFAAPHSGEFNR